MMDERALELLLQIKEQQGQIVGELKGLHEEQRRAANEMVRVWESTSEIETRVSAVETKHATIRAYAAGVSATVALVWFIVTELLPRLFS